MGYVKCLVATALVMVWAVPGFAADPQMDAGSQSKMPGAMHHMTPPSQQPETPPGWVVIQEETWLSFIDEPSSHLQEAREAFLQKDMSEASAEVRKTAGYLQVASGRATGPAQKRLTASADELEHLARHIEGGTVTSVKTLDNDFARAEFALAMYRSAKASESWTKKRPRVTGYYLKGAAHSLKNAARWGGHELEYGAGASLDGARIISGKLIQGSGFLTDKVGKAIKSIGTEVESLGKVIQPAGPETSEPAHPETRTPEKI